MCSILASWPTLTYPEEFFCYLFNTFRQLIAFLGRGISPYQGLYLHREKQTRQVLELGIEPMTLLC